MIDIMSLLTKEEQRFFFFFEKTIDKQEKCFNRFGAVLQEEEDPNQLLMFLVLASHLSLEVRDGQQRKHDCMRKKNSDLKAESELVVCWRQNAKGKRLCSLCDLSASEMKKKKGGGGKKEERDKNGKTTWD